MNKHTLAALFGCLAVTSCTIMKVTTDPKQPITPAVQIKDTTPVPVDLTSEIATLLKNQDVDISIREKTMSPEGNLVLTLNGNTYFGDSATITINADRLDDLKEVVAQVKSIMDISAQQSKKIHEIDIHEKSRVPVTYQ